MTLLAQRKKKRKRTSPRMNWKEIDVAQIEAFCESQYNEWMEYPSLRDIFYAFVDILWPNTKGIYKSLSSWLVEKRKAGEIDWRLIRDGSGRERSHGDTELKSLQERVDFYFRIMLRMGKRYEMPRWTDQPKLVVVICEKEADYPVVRSIVRDLKADVAYLRGYSGWRWLFEAAEELEESERELVIVSVGDFDPSGRDIMRAVEDAFAELKQPPIVERAVVTKDQIERFDLPHRPDDQEEIEKLQRDPRFKKWPHGLYRVETAALKSRYPQAFTQAIREAVEPHFDGSLYEDVVEEEDSRKAVLRDLVEEEREAIKAMRRRMRDHLESEGYGEEDESAGPDDPDAAGSNRRHSE